MYVFVVAAGSGAGRSNDTTSVEYRHHLLNDRWIAEAVFPGLRDGYFVEGGACEGRHMSACYALETELGWDGICVEPADELYPLLVQTRSCRTDNRCLWDRTGESVPFTSYDADAARSGITEVNKTLLDDRLPGASVHTVQKPTVTLHDLLAEHDAPSTIHYLALDIEGAEERVLEAFDLRNGPYRVLALSIEGHLCNDLMRDAGYVRAVNPFTTELYEAYFLHPELAEERPLLLLETYLAKAETREAIAAELGRQRA
jgi:FkbM family methyltransferase